jgi:hypothetical protein
MSMLDVFSGLLDITSAPRLMSLVLLGGAGAVAALYLVPSQKLAAALATLSIGAGVVAGAYWEFKVARARARRR